MIIADQFMMELFFIVSPSTPLVPMSPGASISLCPADLIEKIDTSDRVEKEEAIIPPYEEISMPKREFIVPPYWNKVAKTGDELDKELIFSWINHRVLFRQRWGYKRGKQTPEAL